MTERRPQAVLRGARVLTLDAAGTEHPTADIVIDGGVITAIGPGAAATFLPHPDDIDGSGMLAIPGMVNTHFHSPGNFLKGAVPSLPLELFMLYEVPPFMAEPVSETLRLPAHHARRDRHAQAGRHRGTRRRVLPAGRHP